ncbi:MAG TPA: protein kinase [Pseudomonadota bacterium]|nr:protein kinase [Pseudomonadota bacterium]
MRALQPGQVLGGKYRILRPIGAGGMGSVFEVENTVLGGRAALKVLHIDIHAQPELFVRFANEARAANQIGHPGVVTVYDFGQLDDGTPWYVMPMLVGESLAERMKRALKSPSKAIGMEGLPAISDVASALAAAHARDIIHRDLKPGNIMITADPATLTGERAMVLDFGVAKLCADEHTKKGAILGTPLYMPLEQFKDSAAVDGKADVFALGCVAYQILSGKLPHYGQAHYEIMGQRLMNPIPHVGKLVPTLPPAAVELIMAMLATEPDQRPSMVVVEGEVRRIVGLPPPRQSGFHHAVQGPGPSPAAQGGEAGQASGNSDSVQPTIDEPRRTQEITRSGSRDLDLPFSALAVGTPSDQRAVGEISPPSAVPIPQMPGDSIPESISQIATAPNPASTSPAVTADPEDKTATGVPTPLIPDFIATPSAPTKVPSPAQKPKTQIPPRTHRGRWAKGLLGVLCALVAIGVGMRIWKHQPNARSVAPVGETKPAETGTAQATAPPTLPIPAPHGGLPVEYAGLPQEARTSVSGAEPHPGIGVDTPMDIAPPAATDKPASIPAEPTKPIGKPASLSAKGSGRACEPQDVTESCIMTPNMGASQKRQILLAFGKTGVRLCPGERLVFTGLPSRPRIRLAPSSLRRDLQTPLLFALRGLLTAQSVPTDVEIRCRAR